MEKASIKTPSADVHDLPEHSPRRWPKWMTVTILAGLAVLPFGVAAWQGDNIASVLQLDALVLPAGVAPSLLPEVAQALPFL